MTNDVRVDAARSFEAGADAYERHRPRYPEQLFDDIRELAGTRWGARLLEIGAGTGRATLALAERGAEIDAIEPSRDMLDVLAARLASAGLAERVRLREAVFEDVEPEAPYGVAVAAQSFHWADPETRWARLARVIGAGGRAFLFWNAWALDPDAHDLKALAAAYDAHAPGVAPDLPLEFVAESWAEREIAADPHVRLAERRGYEWPLEMPTGDYLELLATVSRYALLSAEDREALFAAIGPLLGASVRLDGSTLLLVVEAA